MLGVGNLLRQHFDNRQNDSVETRASGNLRTDVVRLGQERQGMEAFRARHIGGVGSAASRLRTRLSRDATGRVAQMDQAQPTSFRGAIGQATRRMRARQGIVNRGDAAIRNQALRDRINVARNTASRRGSIHNALQNAAQIREGVNTGVSNANQRIRESRANMFGTLAGAATSYMMNRPKPGEVSQSVDQGTAGADFFNTNPINYDPMTTQPPLVT